MAYQFPYLSQATFLKVAANDASKPFAIAGIPWDGSVTNRPGARYGPRQIRLASHMLCDGIHPLFDNSPCDFLTDVGDLETPNTSLEASRAKIMELVPPLLEKFHMTWIGGDHSVTLPLLRCYAAHFKRPLAVIHFDAHCDTWQDHFGEPSGHGTWVYEAIKEGIAMPECFFQFGIRSSGTREAREFVADQGGIIFTARQLRGKDGEEGLKEFVDQVHARLAQHDNPLVYLTIDIDCLDPAFAPGTGTPEPGGLMTTQVLTLVEMFARSIPMVGMDLVEVAPPYDHSELTSNIGSTLLWTYLCGRGKDVVGASAAKQQ